jgi:hypothetical protein
MRLFCLSASPGAGGRPFIASWVLIFCVDILYRMDQASLNLFQAVRFLPDVFDSLNCDVSPLEQANRLLATRFPASVLRFRMDSILGQDFAVGFHALSLVHG